MKHGKSEPACPKDYMRFLEDRVSNHPHEAECMIHYNTYVKKAKFSYEDYKARYKSAVDTFATRLKEHVENTSGEDEEGCLL